MSLLLEEITEASQVVGYQNEPLAITPGLSSSQVDACICLSSTPEQRLAAGANWAGGSVPFADEGAQASAHC